MTAKTHYDAAYDDGAYARLYDSGLPEWAVAMNLWHVDFVCGLLGLHPGAGPILDLGSGMGHYLSAWEARGFTTVGREISEVAIRKSGRTNIDCGDATNLTQYGSESFQLVFSAAFLEHVSDEQIAHMMKEQMRVARYGAHFIAHEVGNDPGHINIKAPDAWRRFFSAVVPCVVVVPNPLVPVQPAFLHCVTPPAHIQHALSAYGQGA